MATTTDVRVEPLCFNKAVAPRVSDWLLSEWPDWYGSGGCGALGDDVAAFAASDVHLPVGLVVFEDNEPIGFGALRAESIATHQHLSPWATAGYVLPDRRGRGIGSLLLKRIAAHAALLGFPHVYCATSTAVALLSRARWHEIERKVHDGKSLVIFRST